MTERQLSDGQPGRSIETAVDHTTSLNDDSAVFADVRVYRTELFVFLEEEESLESVTLLDPNGQEYGTGSPALGEWSVRFQLLPPDRHSTDEPYESGTYTAIALDGDGNELDELEFDLEPDLSVVGFEAWRTSEPLVVLENTGSGPVLVIGIEITDGFPDSIDGTGLEGLSTGSRQPDVPIMPGEIVTIRLDDSIQFSTEEDAVDVCGDSFEGTFEITTARDDPVIDTLEVDFSDDLYHDELLIEYGCEYVSGGEVMAFDR